MAPRGRPGRIDVSGMDRSLGQGHNENHVKYNSNAVGDFLLFLHGAMKIALVVGLIVLVATAQSPAVAAAQDRHPYGAVHNPDSVGVEHDDSDDDQWPGHRRTRDDEDDWPGSDDVSPAMNLDGTPMAGELDINGNFFGDCGSSTLWD